MTDLIDAVQDDSIDDSFVELFEVSVPDSTTYYLLDGGKYAKIYAQLINLQNENYEQNNENLKIKLEIDKNDISIQKLSEQNKELNEENNKLKEDVLFYEKMLGKRRK